MDFLVQALTDWLKEILVGGIMGNLSGMFNTVNQKVGEISTQVGLTPQAWNGDVDFHPGRLDPPGVEWGRF